MIYTKREKKVDMLQQKYQPQTETFFFHSKKNYFFVNISRWQKGKNGIRNVLSIFLIYITMTLYNPYAVCRKMLKKKSCANWARCIKFWLIFFWLSHFGQNKYSENKKKRFPVSRAKYTTSDSIRDHFDIDYLFRIHFGISAHSPITQMFRWKQFRVPYI